MVGTKITYMGDAFRAEIGYLQLTNLASLRWQERDYCMDDNFRLLFPPTPGQSISDLSVGNGDCYEIGVKLKIVDICTIKDFV